MWYNGKQSQDSIVAIMRDMFLPGGIQRGCAKGCKRANQQEVEYPSPACTEPVMCTSQPRYRLVKARSYSAYNAKYKYVMSMRVEREMWVEPRKVYYAFSSLCG